MHDAVGQQGTEIVARGRCPWPAVRGGAGASFGHFVGQSAGAGDDDDRPPGGQVLDELAPADITTPNQQGNGWGVARDSADDRGQRRRLVPPAVSRHPHQHAELWGDRDATFRGVGFLGVLIRRDETVGRHADHHPGP